MKTIKSILFSVIGILCITLVCVFTLQSCNQKDEVDTSNTYLRSKKEIKFANDLRELADLFKKLKVDNKVLTRGDNLLDDEESIDNLQPEIEEVAEEVSNKLEELCTEYNILDDLDNIGLNAMNISESERENLKVNSSALNQYISNYKTETFRSMLDSRIELDLNSVTLDQVIDNANLKMNEKIALTLIISAQDNSPIDLFYYRGRNLDPCSRDYNDDIFDCQLEFAGGVIVTVIESTVPGLGTYTAAVHAATSVVSYFNCMRKAGNRYSKCKKRK